MAEFPDSAKPGETSGSPIGPSGKGFLSAMGRRQISGLSRKSLPDAKLPRFRPRKYLVKSASLAVFAPVTGWHDDRFGDRHPLSMLATMLDSRTFRQTVGHFVTGVTVVAFDDVDGTTRAMTANSFTSLSLDPPLVLFCVGKHSRTGRSIHDATRFSINILGEGQQDLSTYFAGAWRHDSPPAYTFGRWEGGPRLEGCAASLACEVDAIHEGGDHWIVIGRVVAVHTSNLPAKPLVFFRGAYAALSESGSVA